MRKLPLLLLGSFGPLAAVASDSYAAWVQHSQTVLSVTLLLLVMAVGLMALRWTYRNRYLPGGGKDGWKRYAWRQPLVRLGLAVMAVAGVVNLVVPDPYDRSSPADAAAFAKLRNMPHLAERAYRELVREYPGVVDYHFEWLAAHYQQEEWMREEGEVDVAVGDDPPVVTYYALMEDAVPWLREVAHLGFGMCEFYSRSPKLAMGHFKAITDSSMPYRHLFMGRILCQWGKLDAAEWHFHKEIALGKVVEQSVRELSLMIYRSQPDSLEKLRRLIDDPALGGMVPLDLKRYVYTETVEFGPYMGALVAHWWANLQWIGLLGALLGTGMWFLFLRRLHPQGAGRWVSLLATFLGGAAFTFLAHVLYDFVHYELGFYLTGKPGHDFLYCVLGIGVIEELVKVIPFLLVMQFTRCLRQPIDYLVYVAVSALGFAFMENLSYFDAGHVGIMHGRVLVCVVFHMFATSTVAFGMLLGKFRYRRLQWPFFFLFFVLASLLHGFYDFWLVSPEVSPLALATYALFIYCTFQYATYLNNALNHSPVFQGQALPNPNALAVFLTVGLVGILVFEYFGLSWVYGAHIGNYSLLKSLGMGGFLMFFVILNLSNLDVVEGEWHGLRLWNFGTRVPYHRALGKRLELRATGTKGILAPWLPAWGEVIARVSLNGDSRYFLFRLDQPLSLRGVALEYVLLRAKQEGQVPEPGQGVEAVVVAFRDRKALERSVKRRSDFKVLDSVLIG